MTGATFRSPSVRANVTVTVASLLGPLAKRATLALMLTRLADGGSMR